MRIISIEDANQISDVWNKEDIFKEVENNSSCELLLNTNCTPASFKILAKDDSLEYRDENIIGYLIVPYTKEINIWLAVDDNGDITDGLSICTLDKSASLSECISKAKAEVNKCPVCGKEVPLKEQKPYSFAGRCCKECLPEMREKYEQPGWYD